METQATTNISNNQITTHIKNLSDKTQGSYRARPTKLEWLLAALTGRARACFTGRLYVTLDFNRGGVTAVRIEEVNTVDRC